MIFIIKGFRIIVFIFKDEDNSMKTLNDNRSFLLVDLRCRLNFNSLLLR